MHQLMKLKQYLILILGKLMRNNFKRHPLLSSSTASQVITFSGSFIAGLGDSSLNTQVIIVRNNSL
jgi:hypothetical protein